MGQQISVISNSMTPLNELIYNRLYNIIFASKPLVKGMIFQWLTLAQKRLQSLQVLVHGWYLSIPQLSVPPSFQGFAA